MSASHPPSNNIPPASTSNAEIPLSPNNKHNPDRRSSFNFLRRQKSTESSSKSSMNYSKKKGYQHPPQQPVPRVPPQLPTPQPLPTTDSFGGEYARNYQNMQGGHYDPQGF